MSNQIKKLLSALLPMKKPRVDRDATSIRERAREEIDRRSHEMDQALCKLVPITGLLIPKEHRE